MKHVLKQAIEKYISDISHMSDEDILSTMKTIEFENSVCGNLYALSQPIKNPVKGRMSFYFPIEENTSLKVW